MRVAWTRSAGDSDEWGGPQVLGHPGIWVLASSRLDLGPLEHSLLGKKTSKVCKCGQLSDNPLTRVSGGASQSNTVDFGGTLLVETPYWIYLTEIAQETSCNKVGVLCSSSLTPCSAHLPSSRPSSPTLLIGPSTLLVCPHLCPLHFSIQWNDPWPLRVTSAGGEGVALENAGRRNPQQNRWRRKSAATGH
jgi:hypothetical protein